MTETADAVAVITDIHAEAVAREVAAVGLPSEYADKLPIAA